MPYEPTNWKSGDVVTSAKLNKIEGGIASGGVLVVTADYDGKLDKTWQEIHDAACSVLKMNNGNSLIIIPCIAVLNDAEGLAVQFYNIGEPQVYTYVADSTDSYPIIEGE